MLLLLAAWAVVSILPPAEIYDNIRTYLAVHGWMDGVIEPKMMYVRSTYNRGLEGKLISGTYSFRSNTKMHLKEHAIEHYIYSYYPINSLLELFIGI